MSYSPRLLEMVIEPTMFTLIASLRRNSIVGAVRHKRFSLSSDSAVFAFP
jgi:hypothetical protein